LKDTTPVTEETFREWKTKRLEAQKNELEKLRLEKQELLKKKSGKCGFM
jgi:hypothetical protein